MVPTRRFVLLDGSFFSSIHSQQSNSWAEEASHEVKLREVSQASRSLESSSLIVGIHIARTGGLIGSRTWNCGTWTIIPLLRHAIVLRVLLTYLTMTGSRRANNNRLLHHLPYLGKYLR